jgi:hypothetical protein
MTNARLNSRVNEGEKNRMQYVAANITTKASIHLTLILLLVIETHHYQDYSIITQSFARSRSITYHVAGFTALLDRTPNNSSRACTKPPHTTFLPLLRKLETVQCSHHSFDDAAYALRKWISTEKNYERRTKDN